MFTNLKIVFLPVNTTLRCQPLDAGVIRAFKVRYRKLFLIFVVFRINHGLSAVDITNEVDVCATSYTWIKQAWNEVLKEIVRKCFGKSGFSEAVYNSGSSEEEEDRELKSLYCASVKTKQQLNNML